MKQIELPDAGQDQGPEALGLHHYLPTKQQHCYHNEQKSYILVQKCLKSRFCLCFLTKLYTLETLKLDFLNDGLIDFFFFFGPFEGLIGIMIFWSRLGHISFILGRTLARQVGLLKSSPWHGLSKIVHGSKTVKKSNVRCVCLIRILNLLFHLNFFNDSQVSK